MDTTWFAVDAHGRIGVFDSGEDGAVPSNAATGLSPSDPTIDDALLFAHVLAHARQQPLEVLSEDEVMDLQSRYLPQDLAQLPVFFFSRDHGDDPGRYEHSGASDAPLRVQALPESLRGPLQRLRIPVDFSQRSEVHLADHFTEAEVETWGDLPLRYTDDYFAQQQQRAEDQQRALHTQQRFARQVLVLVVLCLLAGVIWALL